VTIKFLVPPRTSEPPAKVPTESPAAQAERRRSNRVRLSLETAVPVHVRWDGLVQWGIARNISEGGMLIELRGLPSIGSRVEITFSGIDGSADAPDPATLHGEVRHHVVWNVRGAGLSAIGIRFVATEAPLAGGPLQ
jgi:hypothetical protein